MKTAEAIEVAEGWFAYMDRQRARAVEMQRLAAMARAGDQAGARRGLAAIDASPAVYDGARLEPAVIHLVKLARASQAG